MKNITKQLTMIASVFTILNAAEVDQTLLHQLNLFVEGEESFSPKKIESADRYACVDSISKLFKDINDDDTAYKALSGLSFLQANSVPPLFDTNHVFRKEKGIIPQFCMQIMNGILQNQDVQKKIEVLFAFYKMSDGMNNLGFYEFDHNGFRKYSFMEDLCECIFYNKDIISRSEKVTEQVAALLSFSVLLEVKNIDFLKQERTIRIYSTSPVNYLSEYFSEMKTSKSYVPRGSNNSRFTSQLIAVQGVDTRSLKRIQEQQRMDLARIRFSPMEPLIDNCRDLIKRVQEEETLGRSYIEKNKSREDESLIYFSDDNSSFLASFSKELCRIYIPAIDMGMENGTLTWKVDIENNDFTVVDLCNLLSSIQQYDDGKKIKVKQGIKIAGIDYSMGFSTVGLKNLISYFYLDQDFTIEDVRHHKSPEETLEKRKKFYDYLTSLLSSLTIEDNLD